MYKNFSLGIVSIGAILFLSGCSIFPFRQKPTVIPQGGTISEPTVTSSPNVSSSSSAPQVLSEVKQNCSSDTKPYLVSFLLPFHKSKQSLQVTSDVPSNFCDIFPTFTLTLTNPRQFVGTIEQVSYTGNSAGIFVPFAVTKDDESLLLKAVMGSPGAGGSDVHYGYAQISLTSPPKVTTPFDDFPIIATDQAYFYDTYGKVLYIEEGENTPVTPKPGPGNNSVMMFRNLVTGEKRILLSEKDESYKITEVNEKTGLIKFEATTYQFSESCPRDATDALYCAQKTRVTRTLPIPQK